MTSDYVSYPQRPLTPTELLRVGAALLPFGLPFGNGYLDQEIWIAMETDLPHMVIGVVPSHEEATALITTREDGAPPAEVYGPFAPPPATMAFLDETDPVVHDDTKLLRSETSLGILRDLHRKQGDVKHMTLTIEWEPRDDLPSSVQVDIQPHTDTIFLTRGSREAFGYPRYLSIFGPAYLAALRQRLGDT